MTTCSKEDRTQSEKEHRVLSIQSHVVYGHVGNKCATLPLQLLGFEVDAINTVQFSNHTGYGSFKGTVMDGHTLREIVDGMHDNGLLHQTHLLTGYARNSDLLRTVVRVIKQLREQSPTPVMYVCDPVLGDDGKLYVPAELTAIFRDEVMPFADVITPNQFELEQLSGCTVESEEQAWHAMDQLHQAGPSAVVLTSTTFGTNQGQIVVLASTTNCKDCNYDSTSCNARIRVKVPLINSKFTGTGDLVACLLLAWLTQKPHDLAEALLRTLATVHSILQRTVQHGSSELRLVQSIDNIMNPMGCVQAMGLKADILSLPST